MEFFPVAVQCCSGCKTEEVPQKIILSDHSLVIMQVIDSWYEGSLASSHPLVDYFKVKTMDGTVYLLCHELDYDQWSAAKFLVHPL